MKNSSSRILTTHVGSLARPAELMEMMWAKENGGSYDPETVAHWASLWVGVGMDEARATTLAQEFLEYCQTAGQTVTIAALNKWAHCQTEA